MPWVSHIINFDFPKTTSDYLHRAGRAGRAGREGFVMSLYRERDLPILNEMKSSQDTGEPLKIKGSAYSLKDKESFIGAKSPRMGQQQLNSSPAYRTRNTSLVEREAAPGTKTRKESMKTTKENDRMLRSKNKPLSRKLTDQDLPKFQAGKQWRTKNSSARIKEAIERN
jgi:superfamily II DNA/RNA helicase